MMKLAESDLFIYVGLGLEGFVEKAKSTLKDEKVTLLEAGGNIHIEGNDNYSYMRNIAEEDDHNHGDIDPHVWLDPIYSKELAASIKEALIKQMPENEETFDQNYDALVQKLDTLNNDFSEVISQAEQSEIIVSHAALWLLGITLWT